MNINSSNSELLSEEMIYDIKVQFDKYNKKLLNWDDFKEILINFGYNPEHDEIIDIIAETNNQIDFIYCLVIIGRVIRFMKSNELRNKLILAFSDMDANNNGTIELDELRNYMKKHVDILKTNNNDLKILFDSIDVDHDGHITKKEFFEYLDNCF